jgi:hypothetical protein
VRRGNAAPRPRRRTKNAPRAGRFIVRGGRAYFVRLLLLPLLLSSLDDEPLRPDKPDDPEVPEVPELPEVPLDPYEPVEPDEPDRPDDEEPDVPDVPCEEPAPLRLVRQLENSSLNFL